MPHSDRQSGSQSWAREHTPITARLAPTDRQTSARIRCDLQRDGDPLCHSRWIVAYETHDEVERVTGVGAIDFPIHAKLRGARQRLACSHPFEQRLHGRILSAWAAVQRRD